jgi:xanthosine utilization system XapX-like protein
MVKPPGVSLFGILGALIGILMMMMTSLHPDYINIQWNRDGTQETMRMIGTTNALRLVGSCVELQVGSIEEVEAKTDQEKGHN